MLDTAHGLLTLLPLPVWVAMLLFPRAGFTRRLVTSNWPLISLGGVSGVLLIAALAASLPGGASLSAEALRAALGTDLGFLAAWSQLLTLALFAGIWVFRDAKYWGFEPVWYLLAIMFCGPLGLALYLWRRERLGKRDPARYLN